MHFGISAQCVTDNYEEKITDGDDQSHGETNRRLATMRRDAKGHPNNREGDAGERKGKTFVYFRPARAAFPLIFTLELLKQLLDRQGRAARAVFFFVFFISLLGGG